MRRPITVGHGFGKTKPNDLVNKATSGDIIVFDKSDEPYVIENGLSIPSSVEITFRSNGRPEETVIDSSFTIEGKVFFQNVTLDLGHSSRIHLLNQSRVVFDNVIIKNSSDLSPLLSNNSRVVLKRVTFFGSEKNCTINFEDYSEVEIDSSLLSGIEAMNGTLVQINNSKIDNMLIIGDHSKLNSENLYVDYENSVLPLYLSENSKANITNFYLIGEGSHYLVIEKGSTATIGNINATITPKFAIDNESILNTQAIVDVSILEDEQSQQQSQQSQQSQSASVGFENSYGIDSEFSETEIEPSGNEFQNQNKQNTTSVQEEPNDNKLEFPTMAQKSLEELNKLIGLESVKKTVNMFIDNVKVNQMKKESGMHYDNISLHSVFLGNPGTGKTTVARLLGKILYYNGVIPSSNFVEVSRNQLVSGYVGQTAEQTQKLLEDATGGILFIDEAYTLYDESSNNPGQESLDTILKYMEDHRDEIMIIFAGYTNEMYDFFKMNPGLQSRVQHQFMFEDYNDQQMIEIGESTLNKQGLTYNKELYRKQMTKALHQSNDNSNARWVRNFNEKLVMIQNSRLAKENELNKDALKQISDEDILQMSGKDNEQTTLEELLEELHSLVGLANVKTFVSKLVKEVKANKMFEEKGMILDKPTYHMVFTGPPGTGKTTIARLIAKIFYSLDILAEDKVVEVDRQNLVGAYIGHTEKNTAKAVDQAMGGVLFVDEAYQLASGSENDFGHLAIETLITSLENYRDKFIAIFAGYTNDMERFLDENEGLKSRIPYTIEFPAYSSEEVAEIVYRILNKDWSFDKGYLLQAVSQAYENQSEDLKANGRWARNTAQKILSNHKAYVVEHVDELKDITEINNETILNTLNEQ
ncbi:AAA family ATPase [Staphylococcus simulans]|uniref:AAA family ATPase n=1 Tax=Staphylococcus simulans TaxID=1286 RepID=UPI0021CE21BD|nr:AAA family ATPase [Staphylococcus simulans]UXR44736.1 AAA family ATPase [Staphylococcus simulans]